MIGCKKDGKKKKGQGEMYSFHSDFLCDCLLLIKIDLVGFHTLVLGNFSRTGAGGFDGYYEGVRMIRLER